jgi:hypothetical protein
MMEQYASIMKNDVWEVVPRTKGKKVVGSKWIYKARMQQMEAWKSTKPASWPRGFHSERELTMRRLSPWWPGIPQSE